MPLWRESGAPEADATASLSLSSTRLATHHPLTLAIATAMPQVLREPKEDASSNCGHTSSESSETCLLTLYALTRHLFSVSSVVRPPTLIDSAGTHESVDLMATIRPDEEGWRTRPFYHLPFKPSATSATTGVLDSNAVADVESESAEKAIRIAKPSLVYSDLPSLEYAGILHDCRSLPWTTPWRLY